MKKLLFILTVLTFSLTAGAATKQVWTGSFNAGTNWADAQLLDGSLFSDISAGDVINFKGSAYSDAKIQIAAHDYSSYITSNQYNCVDFNGDYAVTVTSSNMGIFKSGVYVKGQNMTLTSVTLTGNGSSDEGGGGSTGTGSFSTNGTKLLDGNGNEFIMRGVNYSYAWQQGHEGTVLPAAKRQSCNTVRIQISDGTKWTKTTESEISRLISLCEANKLICVLNVQDELGSDDISALEKAANYWISMKNAVIGHENTTIVNIANEWDATWESSTWASGYTKVIPMLRNAGIKNTLMVDCAGYGQYPDAIWQRGSDVLNADTQHNLMFSIHMYEYAGGSSSKVTSAIDNALGVNAPLVIGEFGYKHRSGDVAWQTILDYTKTKSVGYMGWSWTGNGDGVEFLDMFSGYDDSSMLYNGQCILNGTNGIKATSKECSIYNTTGIETAENECADNVARTEYYSLSGQQLTQPVHGVNIVRMYLHNGRTVCKKIYMR